MARFLCLSLAVLSASAATLPLHDVSSYEASLLDHGRKEAVLLLFSPAPCSTETEDTIFLDYGVHKQEEPQESQVECNLQHLDKDREAVRSHTSNTVIDLNVDDHLHLYKYHQISPATQHLQLLYLPPRSRHFQRLPQEHVNYLEVTNVTDIIAFMEQLAGNPPSASSSHEAKSFLEYIPFLLLVVVGSFFAYDNRSTILPLLRTKTLWFSLSLLVLYLSLSGTFHSVIHRPPLIYFHPVHGLFIMHPTGRRQFILEGLVCGSWSVWISLAGLVLLQVLPSFSDQSAKLEVLRMALFLVGISYVLLSLAFSIKNRWLYF